MLINLPGFKPGDPITIMNTISTKLINTEGKFSELLTLIYKDNNTGLKHKTEIIDPLYSFYVANEDKRVRYNRLYVPQVDVTEHTCKHKEVDRECCKVLGMKNWFSDMVQSGNRREIKKIHTHPDLFMSDINLEDYYRFWFGQEYQNEQCPISKAYYDIEADTINMAGDFPELGECPVNAITYIHQNTMQVYTFLLRNSKNPQISEFEEDLKKNGTKELHDFVYNHIIEKRILDPKIKDPSLGVENFKYTILFYDEDKEIDLISDFFALINHIQPDFAMAWNQAFDLPYMIARCKALGYDPAEIMSHPDFDNHFANYYIDERALNEPEERCDFAIISSYTTFLDQLIQFASRRKGQTKFASFSLDYVANEVASVGKLDYKDITTNISDLPYANYKTFVFYNVCDVVAQYCIEKGVEDIDYVFGKALMNNTRYSKVHRQTVYLANRGMKEFYNDGYIMGNNINKFNDPPTEKFGGAFVADPAKVSDHSRMMLNGHPVNLFDNCDDFDYKALYPSILRQFNVFAYTQIGRLEIPHQIHENENRRHIDHWSRSGAFIEDFQSHQWLECGHRWFNLPDYSSLVTYIQNLYTNHIRPSNSFGFENSIGKLYFPVIIQETYQPVIFTPPMSGELEDALKEWKEYVVKHPNQSF